jgi:hypothetical protein
MSDAAHRPRKGQQTDPAVACRHLELLLDAANALCEAWDPVLDRGYPRYFPSFDDVFDALVAWRDEVTEWQAVAEDEDLRPVNFADPVEARRWLKDMRNQVDDAVAAGEDATRPLSKRGLSRLMARRMVLESRHALLQLLQAAERGLGQSET